MNGRPALILHGGAGARRERDYTLEIAHMGEVVAAMKARLDAGASALDVAVEAPRRTWPAPMSWTPA